tara:strand:+ start:2661 stop:2873 length:213 start_codon:yes stop_codon:yes gene_type:complete
MNELINKRLGANWGKRIKIFMENGFFFEGVLLENDVKHLVLKDRKKGNRILKIEDISNLEIYGESDNEDC